MTSRDVLEVIDSLEATGVTVWLDGGWGVDALLGEETRMHDDLDLVVPLDDVDRVVAALAPLGYKLSLDKRPTRLAFRADSNRRVDLHPVVLSDDGSGRQIGAGPAGGNAVYPAKGFSGHGRIDGRAVGCLTPQLLLKHHTGYPPQAKDRHNVLHLCGRFGLPVPQAYR